MINIKVDQQNLKKIFSVKNYKSNKPHSFVYEKHYLKDNYIISKNYKKN